MRSVELNAQTRTESGKGPARRTRAAGRVPAIVYGEAKTPQPVSVDSRELSHIVRGVGGEHVIVNLIIDERPPQMTLLREAAHDSISGRVEHIDFLRISADKPVQTMLLLMPMGTSEGQKTGGIFEQHIREIEVLCLPLLIPDRIEYDISAMEIGDTIHVSDLSIPEEVKVITPKDHPVAVVLTPTKVEEEEAVVEEGEAEEGEATPEGEAKAEGEAS